MPIDFYAFPGQFHRPASEAYKFSLLSRLLSAIKEKRGRGTGIVAIGPAWLDASTLRRTSRIISQSSSTRLPRLFRKWIIYRNRARTNKKRDERGNKTKENNDGIDGWICHSLQTVAGVSDLPPDFFPSSRSQGAERIRSSIRVATARNPVFTERDESKDRGPRKPLPNRSARSVVPSLKNRMAVRIATWHFTNSPGEPRENSGRACLVKNVQNRYPSRRAITVNTVRVYFWRNVPSENIHSVIHT